MRFSEYCERIFGEPLELSDRRLLDEMYVTFENEGYLNLSFPYRPVRGSGKIFLETVILLARAYKARECSTVRGINMPLNEELTT